MRKPLTALLLGAMAVTTAAPAFADPKNEQELADQLRARIAEKNARYHEERERRDDRAERRQERREERAERREDRRDDRRDRREERREHRRDDRRDWWGDDWNDRRGYAYRDYGGHWNRQWTPYGFGYHDDFTRSWVLRNFADRNGNGRISEGEWRRAQVAFYRFADRNGDGYITRFEYDWAERALRSNYGYRW